MDLRSCKYLSSSSSLFLFLITAALIHFTISVYFFSFASCDSLKIVNNSYHAEEMCHYRLKQTMFPDCKGMCSCYLLMLPACLPVWSVTSLLLSFSSFHCSCLSKEWYISVQESRVKTSGEQSCWSCTASGQIIIIIIIIIIITIIIIELL